LVHAVLADHRHVRRDDDRLEAVNVLKLVGLGVRRASHPCELLVHPKVVLEGDGRERLVLLLNVYALFRLNGLVQAIRPPATWHQTAGKFIDDDDITVLYHVMLVAMKEVVSP